MKRSLGGTCGVASGCLAALLSLQGCQAFLCPAATTRMIASGSRRWEVSQKREEFQQDQRQPRRMVTRYVQAPSRCQIRARKIFRCLMLNEADGDRLYRPSYLYLSSYSVLGTNRYCCCVRSGYMKIACSFFNRFT